MVSTRAFARIVEAARGLQPAESSYLETDFVMYLRETLLDCQTSTTAVVRTVEQFRDRRIAETLGLKAYELDWRIWEASRRGVLPYPGPV